MCVISCCARAQQQNKTDDVPCNILVFDTISCAFQPMSMTKTDKTTANIEHNDRATNTITHYNHSRTQNEQLRS